jgi:hypothetical protein
MRSNLIAAALMGLPLTLGAWLATPQRVFADSSIIAGHIVNVAGKVRIRKDGSKDTKDVRMARAGDVIMVGDIINTPSDGMIKLLMKDKSLMDLGPSSLFKVNSFQANAGADRQMESTIVYGSLRAAVTQQLQGRGSFKVRSPSATMGVRGTEFVVKSEMPDPKSMSSFLNGRSSFAGSGGLTSPSAPVKSEITVLQGQVELAMPKAPKIPSNSLPTGPMGGAGGSSPIASTGAGTLMLAAGAQVVSQVGGNTPAMPAARVLDSNQLTQVASTSRVADNTFSGAVEIKATKEDERKEMAERRSQPQQQQQQVASSEGAKSGDKAGEKAPDKAPEKTPEKAPEAVASSGSAGGANAAPASAPGDAPAQQTAANTSGPAPGAAPPPPGAPGGADRGPASLAPMSGGGLAMASFVQTAITSVQLGSSVTQTIRPADFVPAVPLSATGIQTQALPNINQLHVLTVRVKLTP